MAEPGSGAVPAAAVAASSGAASSRPKRAPRPTALQAAGDELIGDELKEVDDTATEDAAHVNASGLDYEAGMAAVLQATVGSLPLASSSSASWGSWLMR